MRVEAEDLATGMVTHTNSAYLVFVALGDNGRPITVPPLVPRHGRAARRWFAEAQERRRKRLAERQPAD